MEKPNILLIHTDQQRWDAVGVNGNPDIKTPNLDQLAEEGINFDHYPSHAGYGYQNLTGKQSVSVLKFIDKYYYELRCVDEYRIQSFG